MKAVLNYGMKEVVAHGQVHDGLAGQKVFETQRAVAPDVLIARGSPECADGQPLHVCRQGADLPVGLGCRAPPSHGQHIRRTRPGHQGRPLAECRPGLLNSRVAQDVWQQPTPHGLAHADEPHVRSEAAVFRVVVTVAQDRAVGLDHDRRALRTVSCHLPEKVDLRDESRVQQVPELGTRGVANGPGLVCPHVVKGRNITCEPPVVQTADQRVHFCALHGLKISRVRRVSIVILKRHVQKAERLHMRSADVD